MPRRQTARERAEFALQYGERKPVTYLIPYFADEGKDNSYFVNEPAELVHISVADLQELLG